MEKLTNEQVSKIEFSFVCFTLVAILIFGFDSVQKVQSSKDHNRIIDSKLTVRELEQKYSIVFGEMMIDRSGYRLGFRSIDVYPAKSLVESIRQQDICGYRMIQIRRQLKKAVGCIPGYELNNRKFFKQRPHFHNNYNPSQTISNISLKLNTVD